MPFSDKQKHFLKLQPKDINTLSGVTGSAKSFTLNLRMYGEILEDQPNDTTLFTGKTLDTVMENIAYPFMELDEGIGDYQLIKGNRPKIYCKRSKANIMIIGANDESAETKIRGRPKMRRWVADEVTLQPRSLVDQALARCKYVRDGKMVVGEAWWTMNPDGPHHYIKTEYMDNPKINIQNTYWGFEDNPLMTKDFIEKQKARYSGVFYERMILGKWTAAEGAIYTDFNPATHIIDKPLFPIREYIIGADWGFNHPMAIVLIGIDYDGRYYVMDEFHESGYLVDERLKEVLIAKGWDKLNITRGWGDSESPGDVERLRKLMNWQIMPAVKGPNSVIDGIKVVQSLLKKKPDETFGLYFINGMAPKTQAEMSTYRWALIKAGSKGDAPIKEKDDGMDAMRYPIFARAVGTVRPIKNNPFK